MSRYLAVSGRVVSPYDLRGLGLIAFIVEDEPHFCLADTLAHTIHDRF